MIDLHTHSTASDGFLTPVQVLEKAVGLGLEALALTDHDTVSGLAELRQAAAGKKIEIVNGAELSAFYPGAEMEILALDIPEKALAAFGEAQQLELARRDAMTRQRIEMLQEFGVDITYDEVAFDENGNRREQVRRPHFTDVLLKKGYIQEAEEAYQVIFAKGGIAFIENRPAAAQDIIGFIRDNGAQAVMAHPIHTGFDGRELFETVKKLQKIGLNGIEVFHSSQPRELRRGYLEIIRELGLKSGGGSDFHGGTAHPENELGTGRKHNLNMPYSILAELRAGSTPAAAYYDELAAFL